MAQLVYEIIGNNISLANAVNDSIAKIQLLQKSVNDLNKGASSNGLGNAIAQANSQALNFKKTIDDTNLSLKDKTGLAALDQLGQKLLVIRGNADLFGQTLKNQQSELGAYQTALNRLLSAGFDPLDGDVLKLKGDIDSLTASMVAQNAATVRRPIISDSRAEVAQSITEQHIGPVAASGSSALIAAFNKDLAEGKITLAEYNAAIATAAQNQARFAATTNSVIPQLTREEGLLEGLNAELAILKQQRFTITNTADLAKQNVLIAETEAQIAALNNVGKAGFDKFGNAIKEGTGSLGGFGKGLTSAFGSLRQLAYILPGIGIAGIFTLGFEAISKAAEGLDLFGTKLTQIQSNLNAFNALNKEAASDIGKQIAPLRALYDATQNVNLSIEKRLAAAQQLREMYPAEFANTTNLAIVNGDLKKSYDDLTDSIIANAKSLAAQSQIAKEAEKAAQAAFQIQKINNARAQEINNVRRTIGPNGEGGELAQRTIDAANLRAQTALKPQQEIIDKAQNTIKFLEGFVKQVGQTATKLDEANKLLGNSQQNFFLLIAKASSKADLENIQSALQVKLNSLAPNDSQIAGLKAKLEQVKLLIQNAYDVKIVNQSTRENTFEALKKQLEDIFNKSAHLADQSGLKGYALDVQQINDKYKDLNRSIDEVIKKGQTDLKSRKITQSQFGVLSATAKDDRGQLAKDQAKEISDAQIKEATRVSNEIQRIRDEFGVRSEQSRNKELASIQLRYDKEVKLAQGNQDILAAAAEGRLAAFKTINEKYVQLEQDLWNKLGTIDDQAQAEIGDRTSVETGRIIKEWEQRRQAAKEYYDELIRIGKSDISSALAGFNVPGLIANAARGNTNTGITNAENADVNLAKNRNILSGLQNATSGFISDFLNGLENANSEIGANFQSVFAGIASSFQKTMTGVITGVLGRLLQEKLEQAAKGDLAISKGLQAGIAAAGIGGAVISGLTPKTSTIGQGLGGALSGAASGAAIGSLFGGPLIGGVIGGTIGLLSGIFSSNKAQKELQAQQLEQQKQQTAALKASLAYTSQIIGRMTNQGVITGVDLGATGQLVAVVNGKQLQFILDRR